MEQIKLDAFLRELLEGKLMKAIAHATVSLAIGLPLYVAFSSVEAYVFCVLTGVFLDVDHFIDYLLWSKDRNLKKFFILGPDYSDDPHPTDKFLHSIDLFSIFVIPIMLYQPILSIGIIAGFAGHIALDLTGFGFGPFYFFFSYRVVVGKRKILSLREAILKKDGFRCKDCGATDNLHIHRDIKLGHLNGWDRVEEWTTVCERCHIQRHKTGMFF